jgi:hypothetical protein
MLARSVSISMTEPAATHASDDGTPVIVMTCA